MSERADFERHWYNFYHSGSIKARSDGRYMQPVVQHAWDAWQASRLAALEEAANACLVAEPDAATRKAFGDAAPYVACAKAIRSIDTGDKA